MKELFFELKPAVNYSSVGFNRFSGFERKLKPLEDDFIPINDEFLSQIPVEFHRDSWKTKGIPKVTILKSGTKWMDCLLNEGLTSAVVVSQKVIDSIIAHKLTGLEITPVYLEIPKANKRIKTSPFNYYEIFPQGKSLKFLYRVFQRIGKGYGKDIKYVFKEESINKEELQMGEDTYILPIPILSEWDRNDFIPIREGKRNGSMYCSRRVVEIAKEDNWSNFEFRLIDSVGNDNCMDFREKTWPPETWYPPNQPEGPHCVE